MANHKTIYCGFGYGIDENDVGSLQPVWIFTTMKIIWWWQQLLCIRLSIARQIIFIEIVKNMKNLFPEDSTNIKKIYESNSFKMQHCIQEFMNY